MTSGEFSLSREIGLGIQRIDGRDVGRVFNVQRLPCQHFIEEPGTPGARARWGGPDEVFEDGFGHRLKCALKYQQVDIFVAQCKGQMIGHLVAGLIALVEDTKTTFLSLTASDMFLRDTAWLPDGRLETECMDERRPTDELRPFGNDLVLEADWCFQFKVHGSKIYCSYRKSCEM